MCDAVLNCDGTFILVTMVYTHLSTLNENLHAQCLTDQTRILITSLSSLYAMLFKKFNKYTLEEQQWIVTYGVSCGLLNRYKNLFLDQIDSEVSVACRMLIKQTVWACFASVSFLKCTPAAANYFNVVQKTWREEFNIRERTFDEHSRYEKDSFLDHAGRRRFAAMIEKQISAQPLTHQLFKTVARAMTRTGAAQPDLCSFMLTLNDDTLCLLECTFTLINLLRAYTICFKHSRTSRVTTLARMKMLFQIETLVDEFMNSLEEPDGLF